MKHLCFISIFFFFSVNLYAAQPGASVPGAGSWDNTPPLSQDIESYALQVIKKQGEMAPKRIATYDIAYPKDLDEYIDLKGNAILKISAISKDKTELPLKNVYIISANNKKINLNW